MTPETEKEVREALAEAQARVAGPPDPEFGPHTLTCTCNARYLGAIANAGPALLAEIDELRERLELALWALRQNPAPGTCVSHNGDAR